MLREIFQTQAKWYEMKSDQQKEVTKAGNGEYMGTHNRLWTVLSFLNFFKIIIKAKILILKCGVIYMSKGSTLKKNLVQSKGDKNEIIRLKGL